MKKILTLTILLFLINTAGGEDYQKYLLEGNTHFQKKDYEAAVEKYKKALKIAPDDATLNYNLGVTYYNQGKTLYKDAIFHYERTIKIDPEHIDAYYNLGVIYFNLQEYQKAEEHFNKAREILPSDESIKEALKMVKIKKEEKQKKDKEKKPKEEILEIKVKEDKKSKSPPPSTYLLPTRHKVVICKNILDRNPVDEADIFGENDERVVVWVGLVGLAGKHNFQVKWINPSGATDHIHQYDFAAQGGRYRVWVEKKVKGSKMGNMKGKWKVEILLDNNLVAVKIFEIK